MLPFCADHAALWLDKIFCGYEHTFALTSDGDVMGFGNGIKGQLGIGNTESHNSPQRVHLLCGKGVVMMAAGLEHSLALTDSGDLYSFGDNLSGQLGLGHNYTAREQTPQKVIFFSKSKITQMACGQDHTAILTSTGELFCFGNNRSGALGLPGHDNEGPPIVESTPKLVSSLQGMKIVQIGCGLQHTVALTVSGSVYCWGENGRGQLGTGDTHNRYTPSLVCKPLSAARCIHVACGGQHTIAVTDRDDVYGFGSDRHGQLGLGQGSVASPFPTRIVRLGGRRVEHAVGGAWHTVVGTDTGENYIMGCILPEAPIGENANLCRNSKTSVRSGVGSCVDPFALGFGGFRRLVLPRGAAACSKGHSLFYGQGLGAPPLALRQVVRSLDDLKKDFSKMLKRQEPDVIFTARTSSNADAGDEANANNANTGGDGGGGTGKGEGSGSGGGSGGGGGGGGGGGSGKEVGAHMAVLRARCPSLFEHATKEESHHNGDGDADGDGDGGGADDCADGKPRARRVYAPALVPIDALQLVISYLYQDAGVFDKPKPGADETSSHPRSPTGASGKAKGRSRGDWAATSQPDRLRDRRERLWAMRVKTGAASEDCIDNAEEGLAHGTMEVSMDPWDEVGEGEDESAAGFGSFGGAYGSEEKYDGAGLDRLMGVMAAARVLKLNRLQGLCEKRAEAFIDSRTVHKVLRRAAEGGFPYLKRRCLEFCLTHLGEHPQVLANVLSLSAASEAAKKAAASQLPFKGDGKVPCIEELLGAAACVVPSESYQEDFLELFEAVVSASVTNNRPKLETGETMESPQQTAGKKATPEGQHASQRPATTFGNWKPPPRDDPSRSRSKGNPEYRRNMGHPAEGLGDFTIRSGEGMAGVTVHRCILAARSGFFRALLEGTMGDAGNSELTLKFEPVACMDALVEFLRFLYTGRAGAMDPLTALDVLYLTNGEEGSGGFFQVAENDELRDHCTNLLVQGITEVNALPIMVRAKALGDDHSLETAIAFVLDNFDKCMSLPRGVNAILAEGNPREGDEDIPACLKHDDSPAVDLLLALAKRYGQCDGICLSR
eukprot:jgi/Undpi1/5546/HiC_scaffold_2.g00823.m1